MRCTLIGELKGIVTNKSMPLVPLQPTLIKENTSTLLTIDDGAIGISNVSDGVTHRTVILHSDSNHCNAIDIERTLIERTPIVSDEITFLNLDDLVGQFVPDTKVNYTHQVFSDDSGFISKLKSHSGGVNLEFVTNLKFGNLDLDVLKQKLATFTQLISKMSFFLENDVKTATNLGQYLSCWRGLTSKAFSEFTSTQFQPLLSVARHSSVIAFNQCRDCVDYDNDENVEHVLSDIYYIKDNIKQRSSYNFKGVKMYITKEKVSINMLGYLFNNPTASQLNLVVAHLMMCGQLEDFKNKLERTKLLHA